MRNVSGRGQTGMQRTERRYGEACRRGIGVTLIELLCVCAIISILASLTMPAVMRAYRRAKAMQEQFDAPVVFDWLLTRTRNYCAAHPQYQFTSREELADQCDLPSKCREWLGFSRTEFVPFVYLDPTNKVVLRFQYGPKYATTQTFTKGDLCIRPED